MWGVSRLPRRATPESATPAMPISFSLNELWRFCDKPDRMESTVLKRWRKSPSLKPDEMLPLPLDMPALNLDTSCHNEHGGAIESHDEPIDAYVGAEPSSAPSLGTRGDPCPPAASLGEAQASPPPDVRHVPNATLSHPHSGTMTVQPEAILSKDAISSQSDESSTQKATKEKV